MSLLIKALDKAQAEKAQAKGNADKKQTDNSKNSQALSGREAEALDKSASTADLTLSPPKENLTEKMQSEEVPQALKGSAADASQKEALQTATTKPELHKETPKTSNETKRAPTQAQAANVFTAKRIEATNQNAKLAIIVGLVALLIMAVLFYWYQSVINVPDVVIPPRPVANMEMPEPMPELVDEDVLTASALESQSAEAIMDAEVAEDEDNAVRSAEAIESASKQLRTESVLAPQKEAPNVKATLAPNEAVVKDVKLDVSRSGNETFNVGIASDSASIEVTQAKTESGVNPVLMRAYEAYNAGNDNQAQLDYKQVLERYGPNVDAMLGMGAIAVRQGRMADANGWYQKVLEVEPRNDVAKAGLISIRQTPQAQGNESNIKSMLSAAPDDANLHAALGDVYASRAQWSAAQQAYFDAYRYNPSAENAFNLGVSLDQLGKPKLALPYYQEALQKIDQSNAIDKAALEARISSIQ